MSIEQKLQEMGLKLPEVVKPAGAYVPALTCGTLVYTSGQLPMVDGKLKYTGKVGENLGLEEGYQAAAACALNCLAALKSEVGDLNRVKRIVKVTGFVNSAPDFTDQPKVVNGASDLLGKLFGSGHARSAIGVAALPFGAAVEVEMIVEIVPE